ncbi:MAG TPA: hypothetical protein VF808_05945 [Ktedonobacterales bacterium]
MGVFTPFWILIIALALIAAAVNFAIGASRRAEPVVFGVRMAAGLASVAAAAFIILAKLANIMPVLLHWPERLTMAGVFIFAVLFVPSIVERNREQTAAPTIQERAARPANATIRLRDASDSEWIN